MIVFALLILLLASPSWATTYWVSPSGTATLCTQNDGDTDPGSYMTLAQMDTSNCAVAGDTVMFKSGTYTGAHKRFDLLVPKGTSPSVRSKLLCEGNRTCLLNFNSIESNEAGPIAALNVGYYQIGARGQGFKTDCVNVANTTCAGIRLLLDGTNAPTDIIIEGNEIVGNHKSGISMKENHPAAGKYTNVQIRYNRIMEPGTPAISDGPPHAVYLSADDSVVEYNELKTFYDGINSGSVCIHVNHVAVNDIARYNYCEIQDLSSGIIFSDSDTGRPGNSQAYRNVFKATGSNPNSCFTLQSSSDSSDYDNNTCDGFNNYFMNIRAGATSNEFKGNLCTNGTCVISDLGTSTDFGGTASTTNPTVTAASHFKNAAAGDYSLIAGSSQIDAGLDTGIPFNGSAPDRGAYETFTCTTATINQNTMDITCAMNLNTPVLVPSSAGWSVGCTGSGCGTPTVSSISRLSGSDTIIRLTLAGITGNNCAVGQTWTFSYNAATGSASDSADIGGSGTRNQPLHSITNNAVTNACVGSGGGTQATYPGTPYIWYQFEDNANDSSGNANHGTANGITYTTGKYEQAAVTQDAVDDYVELPYLNGVDPSTQSLTIAFGVYVDAADLGNTDDLFGVSLGTNQRLYIYRSNNGNNLRWGVQGTNGTATEFTIAAGWNHVCMVLDAATDTATMYHNGVAGTVSGASVLTYTSYTFASNGRIGLPSGFATSLSGNHRYDDFLLYQSAQSCASIYNAWEPPATSSGVFSQPATRFQRVYEDGSGNPINLGTAINEAQDVVVGGAVAVVIQVDCDECAADSFRLQYRKDGTGEYLQVPDTETSAGIYMWGASTAPTLNDGALSTRLTGTCTMVTGSTVLTSAQVPVVDIGPSGCTVMRYIVRVGDVAGSYFDLRLIQQNGTVFTGAYQLARLNVVSRRGTFGF